MPVSQANNNDIESQQQTRLRTTKVASSTSSSSSSSSSSSPSFSSSSSSSSSSIGSLVTVVFFFCNVALWYVTNGMYGVSMQAFATEIRKHIDSSSSSLPSSSSSSSSSLYSFLSIVAVTATATSFQLLFGVVIGYGTLVPLDSIRYYNQQRQRSGDSSNSRCILVIGPPRHVWCRHIEMFSSLSLDMNLFLGLLHGLGSTFTNLGFMYGSASIVQIIKLLEPFETLLLSHFLLPRAKRPLMYQPRIIASMSLVVGGAVSLIQNRNKAPHAFSIVFAILSGIILSSRNVIQRRQLTTTARTITTTTTNATASSKGLQSNDNNSNNDDDKMENKNSKNNQEHDNLIRKSSSTDQKQQQQQQQQQNHKETTSSRNGTTNRKSNSIGNSSFATLEKSVMKYTELSFKGGACIAFIAFVSWGILLSHVSWSMLSTTTKSAADTTTAEVDYSINNTLWVYWNQLLDWEIFVYHPMYNIFSMITLGFVTALTHSLLNAGKRVFSIVLAILWFSETFTSSTMLSLGIVGMGACWYTVEAKKNK